MVEVADIVSGYFFYYFFSKKLVETSSPVTPCALGLVIQRPGNIKCNPFFFLKLPVESKLVKKVYMRRSLGCLGIC